MSRTDASAAASLRLVHRQPPSFKTLASKSFSGDGHSVGAGAGGRGEQGCIGTAVHRRRRGGTPPPLLPFQCLRLTAKILLRRLRCQEDLSLKIVGPPSVGTIGGPKEEGGPSQPPPFRPPLPLPRPPF